MTCKMNTEDTHYRVFFYTPYPLSLARPKERSPVGERPLSQYLCYFYRFTQEMSVFFDCSNIAETNWFKNFLIASLLLETKH